MFPTDPLDVLVYDRIKRLHAEAIAERMRGTLRARECPLLALARRVAARLHSSPLAPRPATQS